MTQGEILAAGEAAACTIATWPGRDATPAELTETIVTAARLFVDEPTPADLDAVLDATNGFLKAIHEHAQATILAMVKPAGGMH